MNAAITLLFSECAICEQLFLKQIRKCAQSIIILVSSPEYDLCECPGNSTTFALCKCRANFQSGDSPHHNSLSGDFPLWLPRAKAHVGLHVACYSIKSSRAHSHVNWLQEETDVSGTISVPIIRTLTQLCAWEDFIEFNHCESFKLYSLLLLFSFNQNWHSLINFS
jgi:hypothetical protein